ncbi:hypothetical protein JCGZ_06440 [Jatropha curcas]|uniref:Aminotransferase-like plant mobile domain-containing protein n=1 Tax=Jatropha curcas TaxID=180498 RepID=A0A067JC96_JATCU|nr:hypothetical protein JCGZ_06440 [Jatropha curcas]
MTPPSHSSDEDFLESLGISLETDLTADTNTHASVTGIYAQDPHIKLDVGETSVAEISVEIFDHNNPVGAIISPSHLRYLRHFDVGQSSYKELLGALAERWTEVSPDRMVELIGIDLPRIVGPGSATPALSVSRCWLSLQAPDIYARYRQGELTATQVARFTLLLLFALTFWSNRKEKFNPSILKSLENLVHLEEYDWDGAILSRMYDDMCDLSRGHCKLSGTYYFWETWAFEYFPYTRPEPIHADLGLGLSLIQADPHFQRSDALSRRRVVLSLPVLRRYFLGERVDLQIRGCRSVPYSPSEDMRAGKQMTLTDAHTGGVPHVEFILEGDYAEFCRICLMQPIGSQLDGFQRSAPAQPLGTHSSQVSGPSTRTPRRRPATDPSSSTLVEGPSQARPSRLSGPSRAPRAISEAPGPLHPGLAKLRLPYSISYYTPDGTVALQEVSLENVDRLDLPLEDITKRLGHSDDGADARDAARTFCVLDSEGL